MKGERHWTAYGKQDQLDAFRKDLFKYCHIRTFPPEGGKLVFSTKAEHEVKTMNEAAFDHGVKIVSDKPVSLTPSQIKKLRKKRKKK